jgi:hypothetical protein
MANRMANVAGGVDAIDRPLTVLTVLTMTETK